MQIVPINDIPSSETLEWKEVAAVLNGSHLNLIGHTFKKFTAAHQYGQHQQ